MNSKNLSFLLFLFILQSQIVNAQNIKFSIQSGVSFLKIHDLKNDLTERAPLGMADLTYFGNVKVGENFDTKPCFGFNGNLDFIFVNHLFFRTGLGLNYLIYHKRIKIKIPDDQNNLPYYEFDYLVENSGKIMQYGAYNDKLWHKCIMLNDIAITSMHEDLGKIRVINVDIPVKLGYSLFANKLKINSGLLLSFVACSEQYIRISDPYNTFDSSIDWEVDKSSDRFNNTTFAFDTEVSYQFFRKFIIYGRYTKYLSPIYDKQYQFAGKAKYQFLETGIGYVFGK